MASIHRDSSWSSAPATYGLGAGLLGLLGLAVVPLLNQHRAVTYGLGLLLAAFALGVYCGRSAGDLKPAIDRWQQARRARRAQRLNRTTSPG